MPIDGPQRPCAVFEIVENRIVWTADEPLDLAAIEALLPRGAWVSSRQERTAAIDWLLAILGQGPLASAELFAEASACGISPRTLRRAAKSLRLAPRKQGFAEGWVWRLPDAALPPARRRLEDGHFSLAVFDEGGHMAPMRSQE